MKRDSRRHQLWRPTSIRQKSERRERSAEPTRYSAATATQQTGSIREVGTATPGDGTEGPDLLTVPEVALYLRISRNLAYALVARNDIPSLHLGRLIRVPRRELDEWVASEATDAGTAGLSSKGSRPARLPHRSR
jgi:excisionase family DNA binding protein